MCKFQLFRFLCNCDRLQISRPCDRCSRNVQGELFCQNDPHPHIDDGNVQRLLDRDVYGPGVCSNIHCRWTHGLLPYGEFGDDSKAPENENDAAFDMSAETCADREDRWYRMLSTSQQLECLDIRFPLEPASKSLYAQAYFSDVNHSMHVLFERFHELSPDQLHWYELNPRYMTADQLQHATGRLLPASVTVPSSDIAKCQTTPHKPCEGPFKVAAHVCRPKPGICRRCGRNTGNGRERHKQEGFALDDFMYSHPLPTRPSKSFEWNPVACSEGLIDENTVAGAAQSLVPMCESQRQSRGYGGDVTANAWTTVVPLVGNNKAQGHENNAALSDDMEIDFAE